MNIDLKIKVETLDTNIFQIDSLGKNGPCVCPRYLHAVLNKIKMIKNMIDI